MDEEINKFIINVGTDNDNESYENEVVMDRLNEEN